MSGPFTPEEKREIVVGLLTGRTSAAELCRQHQAVGTALYPWRYRFLVMRLSIFTKLMVLNLFSMFGCPFQNTWLSSSRKHHYEDFQHGLDAYGGTAIAVLSSPRDTISGTSVPLLTATVVPLLVFPAMA